ncbi:MAG TPA: HIT family protein [Candidatus Moranbacteria bacterium]|nr:HIT family protein [Candidatus Moranbacteria bacterium]
MQEKKYCLFCDRNNKEKHKIIIENELFYSRWDNFPVAKGHAEIIPKKHIISFFDLNKEELLKMYEIIKETRKIITNKYNPDDFNVGINDGELAGRTIHHLHIHIIPRYKGDVENPKGGIRNIIPGKGNY